MSDGASWAYTDYARINGAPSVRLSTGPLAGMWLTLDERTVRDSTLFTDVDSSAFRNDIIWLATKEITRGCEAYRFCPDSPVTREQMASFLVRSLGLASTTRDFFVDDDGRPAENDINRLAASGITFGCSDHRFCPTRAVTRDQMASFLARALRLPASSSDFFTDDDTSRHEGDINRLAASGITSGCGGSRYCPSAKISRGQMAAFLHRALERPGATSLGLAPATPTPAPTPTPSLSPSPSAEPTATPKPSADQAPSPHPTPSVSPTPTLPQTSPGSSEVLPSGSSP